MESMMATVVTTMTAVSAASEGLRGGLIGGQESQGQGHGGNCREGEFAGHGCFLILWQILVTASGPALFSGRRCLLTICPAKGCGICYGQIGSSARQSPFFAKLG
jgi:hypothetical protein